MKTILIIALLASAGIGAAQTNGTPTIISFTNTLGVYITNAEVVSHSANKLIYRTDDGLGGGTIRLDKLPPHLQEKFNYDPDEANKADQMENDKKIVEKQNQYLAVQRLAAAARLEACKQKMKAQATMICARVIQRLDAGLLLNAADKDETLVDYMEDDSFKNWQTSHHDGFGANVQWASGIVFLAGYPLKNQRAAGDKFIAIVYPAGFYTYTTVNHSESTIRRYTSDFEQAVSCASRSPAEQ